MAWAPQWCVLALWLAGRVQREQPNLCLHTHTSAKAAWLQSTGCSASFRGKVLNSMDYLSSPELQFPVVFQVL